MDIAIFQTDNGGFDIEMANFDLAPEKGLRTAVIISLFTDRRATNDDVIPDNSNDLRGYWGDAFDDNSESMGSRLWLLSREKQTDDVLERAKEYAIEALQWMVNDGVASSVDVNTYWLRNGVLAIDVSIQKANSDLLYEDTFNYELKAA